MICALLTPEEVALRDDLVDALQDLGLKKEAAAAIMRDSAPHFSERLSNERPLNIYALCRISGLLSALASRIKKREGAAVLEPDALQLFLAAATLGKKKTVKMLRLDVADERQSA